MLDPALLTSPAVPPSSGSVVRKLEHGLLGPELGSSASFDLIDRSYGLCKVSLSSCLVSLVNQIPQRRRIELARVVA